MMSPATPILVILSVTLAIVVNRGNAALMLGLLGTLLLFVSRSF